MPAIFSFVVVAFFALTGSARAQGEGREAASPSEQATAIAGPLEAWRRDHGDAWRIEMDPQTGYASLIYGGSAAPAATPAREEDFAALAIDTLKRTRTLHGADVETLVVDRVQFLPLAQIGSTDKVTVRMRQEIDGVRVLTGWVNVLFSTDGALLSIQSTALPRLKGLDTHPAFVVDAARAQATRAFATARGIAARVVDAPTLVIHQSFRTEQRTGRLAWQVDVRTQVQGGVPQGLTYWIDAQDGRVLDQVSNVHEFDVSGTVTSKATPGLAPDTAGNPPTAQVMKYARVQSSAGTVFTDANGNFNYPGVNSPLSVTVTYVGTYNSVVNAAGANYSLVQSLPPNQANSIVMNPANSATVTSQANAFITINKLRDFIRSVNPTDSMADFVAPANVNQADTCNAYYDGVSLNFFASGGGCVNSSYSTVIAHEHGHWMNDKYGTGNGPDGMGEGNADVFAMYMFDNPIVGQDFAGSGNHIRTGLNTRTYCGDASPGCYGEVHDDGEPWMGAAWKIRGRLNTTNGNATGDMIANSLFLAWMNSYNQVQIKSIIETQWLTLDDNDGDINNGTPHYADIDNGFRDQGFPGFTLPHLAITTATDLADTQNEIGPYVVDATIKAYTAGPITSATLRYRSNGGSFTNVTMSNLGGDLWRGSIPGLASPRRVEYYVTATDNAAHTTVYPSGAPSTNLDFNIGVLTSQFLDNFDPAGDNGWTHATAGGAPNPEDDWQHGTPSGKSGTSFGVTWADPASAFSGTRCWANDLGNASSNGSYGTNVHSYLRSPIINLTGKYGATLRLKRWLTVEEAIYDQARILVNGTQVWANQDIGHTRDLAWTTQEINIASLADNNASVRIEFRMKSDGGLELGGWTIDDVQVLTVGIVDTDGDGIANGVDNCPAVANANQANADGDAAGDVCDTCTDTDGDGFGNPGFPANTCPVDGCPSDPNKSAAGACGCGVPDTDTDGDGTPNCNDGCPSDPNKIAPGACGCGTPDTDSDGDGTPNCNDGCPADPNKTAPGICGCGTADTDTDADGTPNCNDGCPLDPNKIAPGACGCGTPDTDTDGDGTPNCNDGCPLDPNKTAAGICGCGTPDTDTDADGTPNCNDGCPSDPNKIAPGACGCGTPDTDTDADGTPDCADGCPADPNKTAPGICGCGTADTDTDADGTPNCNDGCPSDPNKIAPGACGCGTPDTDTDADGTPDCTDGCPADPNKTTAGVCGCGTPDTDTDADGTPDCNDGCATDPNKVAPGACGCGTPDTDTDADGTLDCVDGCPSDPNKVVPGLCGCGTPDSDTDADGTPDCNDGCPADPNKIAAGACGCGVADTDTDLDGVADCNDGCPADPNKIAAGVCGCGVADLDDDADGAMNCVDNCPATSNSAQDDGDTDGVGDACDNCATEPNPAQGDCDTDSIGDACEIAGGAPDCNANTVPDTCDISSGSSFDTNSNGTPDECEGLITTSYCFGDGLDPVVTALCPCGNFGLPGHGCANSNATLGGALLSVSGTTSPNTVLLTCVGMPNNNLATLLRGTTNDPFGFVFGDGVRCNTGVLIRFGQQNVGQGGNPPNEISSATTALPAGQTRYYQCQYRNPAGAFCPPGTFNVSNACTITW